MASPSVLLTSAITPWRFVLFGTAISISCVAPLSSADEDASSTTAEAESTEDAERATPGDFLRVVGSIFGLGSFDAAEEDDASLALLGEPAAAFELQTADGESFRLEDQRGRVVVLDFWATWCGPCVAAMPELQKLQEKFADRNVLVVGVNQRESAEDVAKFVARKEFTFTQVLDEDGSVGDQFGVTGIPQTVVVDPEGVIQAIHSGYSPTLGKKLASEVEKVLSGKTLYDAAAVAAAKARLQALRKEALQEMAPIAEERLQRVGTFDLASPVSLSANYAPAWIRVGSNEERLVLHVDSDTLAILKPGSEDVSTVTLAWTDGLATWDYFPIATEGGLEWAALGYRYDDNYDLDKSEFARFDREGRQQWSIDIPILGEYSPDVSIVAGDVAGDSKIETLLLVEYYVPTLAAAGLSQHPRVLTICDAGGEIVLRTVLPGTGGAGMQLFPGDGQHEILINNAERLDRYRVEEASSPAPAR